MQLSRELMVEAYRGMKTIRVFEERVKEEFEAGNIPGFVHLYVGQEAVAVGVCMNLVASDFVGSTHRGHGHCIAKGCDVKGMMKEIFGRRDGLCGGKGGSMHIADIGQGMLGANGIVGGNSPMVIGAALTAKTLGNGGIAVSFSGDGASNQGTTFESMNMAMVLKLPVIFITENNGYGEFTGVDYSVGSGDISARSAGFGLPTYKVEDGTDFFSVYETIREAAEKVRSGGGPVAIEIICRRLHGHFLGDPQAYRSSEDLDDVKRNDPIQLFRTKVINAGLIDSSTFDDLDSEVEQLVEDAAKEAGEADFPTVADLTSDVYVTY